MLSPDGRQFALARDGQIVLAPAEGGWPSVLTTTAGGKSAPAWSADGKSMAYVSDGSIWTVPAAGGQPVRRHRQQAGERRPAKGGGSPAAVVAQRQVDPVRDRPPRQRRSRRRQPPTA